MTIKILDPILVVCSDEGRSFEILKRLYDKGLSAVGPAPTAGLALTLTAQAMARSAIIAGPTTGRRDVPELVSELSRIWGVECFVFTANPDNEQEWAESQVRRLNCRRAFGAGSLQSDRANVWEI